VVARPGAAGEGIVADEGPLVRVELPAVRRRVADPGPDGADAPGGAHGAQAAAVAHGAAGDVDGPSGPGDVKAAAPLDGVALITIDRPRTLNTLSSQTLAELAAACARLDADPACRVAVFTGAGTRAFSVGADVAEFTRETAEGLEASRRFDHWDAIAAMRIPTIAAVRGYALGGGLELALSCDMLVLGDDARLGQPEIRLGLMPGAGATQRLTRAVGSARATELILTGRTFDAAEADRLGFATRVVPAREVLAQALDLAATIAAMPPLATRAAVEAVRLAAEIPLAAGIREERLLFYRLFGTEDKIEGTAAFLEKREPVWRGR
jgi:enoyl-CoA hydratase